MNNLDFWIALGAIAALSVLVVWMALVAADDESRGKDDDWTL